MPNFNILIADLEKRFRKIRGNIKLISHELELVEADLAEIKDYITYLGKKIDDKKQIKAVAFYSTVSMINKSAFDIFKRNFLGSLESVPEFNNTVLKAKAIEGVNSVSGKNFIEIKFDNQRFSLIDVFIHMDEYFGTIEEYAEAVKHTREELKIKTYLWDINQATKFFSEKYYGVDILNTTVSKTNKKTGETKDVTHKYKGKFFRMMEIRASYFKKYAPWWRLLNDGNVGIGFPGSKGGENSPYFIQIRPTNFLLKTALEIKEQFNFWMKVNIGSETSFLNNSLMRAHNRLLKLEKYKDELIEALEEDPEKALILKRIPEEKTPDIKKLEALARRLEAGEAIPGRIRIGGTVRLRTVELIKEYHAILQGK